MKIEELTELAEDINHDLALSERMHLERLEDAIKKLKENTLINIFNSLYDARFLSADDLYHTTFNEDALNRNGFEANFKYNTLRIELDEENKVQTAILDREYF